MTPQGITLRPAVIEDAPFIYSTWLKAQYFGWACKCPVQAPCCGAKGLLGLIPYRTYTSYYKRVLEGILARNRAIVACLTDDPGVLVGYVVYGPCATGTTVHFMYVKRPWRKLGIAKSLWPEGVVQVSHITKMAKSILPSNIIFNPFEI